jgi:hypothetical protein
MPFNERILTIVMSCKEGIQQCHLPNIEKVSEQVYATTTVELSLCVPFTSVQVRSRLRRLNFSGMIMTLIETKKSFTEFQLQRALIVNARTPYILFLDASAELSEGAISRLIEFITYKNPIKFSIEKGGSDLTSTGALLVCTTLARQIEIEYSSTGLEEESLAQSLKEKLLQEGREPEDLSAVFSLASRENTQEQRSE